MVTALDGARQTSSPLGLIVCGSSPPQVYHTQYEYSADKIVTDRRVSYNSSAYPWLVAAFQYHNKVR